MPGQILSERLFGRLIFGLRSHLGNGNYRAPYTYQNCDLSLKSCFHCNPNRLQYLARPKVIVNDWLTVTNWVPPVNDAQGHSGVTEDGEPGVTLGQGADGTAYAPRKQDFTTEDTEGHRGLRGFIVMAVPRAEKELIAGIRRLAGRSARTARVGIGDDCAVLRTIPGTELLVTTDFSLEGIHFRRDWHPAESVGHRCLARGFSDIAAMGGEPVAAFLSLALPRDLEQKWVNGFFRGLTRLAKTHRVTLAGGDTAESPKGILADIIVVGRAPLGKAVLRSGAKVGDRIFVSGQLGESAAAVEAMRTEDAVPGAQPAPAAARGRLNPRDYPRHFYPEPRVALGRMLLQKRLATSMIDTSDGLSTDLAHICEESGVGAEIVESLIPRARVGRPVRDVRLDLALHGGEDYELLFTARPGKRVPSHLTGVPLTQIGRITRAPGILIRDLHGIARELHPRGWEHFRK